MLRSTCGMLFISLLVVWWADDSLQDSLYVQKNRACGRKCGQMLHNRLLLVGLPRNKVTARPVTSLNSFQGRPRAAVRREAAERCKNLREKLRRDDQLHWHTGKERHQKVYLCHVTIVRLAPNSKAEEHAHQEGPSGQDTANCKEHLNTVNCRICYYMVIITDTTTDECQASPCKGKDEMQPETAREATKKKPSASNGFLKRIVQEYIGSALWKLAKHLVQQGLPELVKNWPVLWNGVTNPCLLNPSLLLAVFAILFGLAAVNNNNINKRRAYGYSAKKTDRTELFKSGSEKDSGNDVVDPDENKGEHQQDKAYHANEKQTEVKKERPHTRFNRAADEIRRLQHHTDEHGFCDGEIIEKERTYIEDAYEYKLEHPPDRPSGRGTNQSTPFYYQAPSGAGRLRSDGRISDDIGDPPGQQTTYIRPGDVRLESYRLSTFENFPTRNPQVRRNLAKAGFIFTGYFDRVKCFSCGRCVEQFGERDDPFRPTWHKESCAMPRGLSCDNVPMTAGFTAAASSPNYQHMQVLQQRDPVSGNVTRTVRYPADLPDRIRSNGGTFQIAPGNMVIIQSGPGPGHNPPAVIGNHSARARWRMANVVSADHRRFLNNLYLNRELDRLSSFARWPISRPNVSPASLAKNGFFYLGDMDRTQCFSCGGVLRNWTLEDDPEEEHRTHFSNCRFTQGLENRNIPIPPRPEPSNELLANYPCRYAASPHMRTKQARLETFNQGWINGRISATPETIAEAGFFFLGERDRVKCWYCNGGLQNWEYEDQPWHEHAKWFPNCQFLLQMKGQSFVFQHLAMNPHLARPIIARQEGSPLAEDEQPGAVARPMDVAPARQPTPPPVIIDPREEMRKKREKVDEIMKNSEVVKNVLRMGFSEDLVRQVIEEQVESEGNGERAYESTAKLLDVVLGKEKEFKREAEAAGYQEANDDFSYLSSYSGSPSVGGGYSSIGTAPGSGMFNGSYEAMEVRENTDIYNAPKPQPANSSAVNATVNATDEKDGPSVREKLRKLQEERMCKICFTKDADIAFIPCGHMCCCAECTQSIRQCPMCRKRIEKAIKTYVT